MIRVYTKDEWIQKMREVFVQGWHPSVKKTIDTRNDGAVGNTLEVLLDIPENNLPIANMREWELKGQRLRTTSLVTLKHSEPSPRGARIVANLLLPYYGWRHQMAGSRYPASEMSFRSTTGAQGFTNRGFTIVIDRKQQKLRFVFDASKADVSNPTISEWLSSVDRRVGLGPLNPEPYWAFDDLRHQIGIKLKNTFYAVADHKVVGGHEYFQYLSLFILSGFSFERFLESMEAGSAFVDFDARTGHNHGTKFRVRQNCWTEFYESVVQAI